MNRIKILFVFGTRPEAIKMAPLILKCKAESQSFDVSVCVTGQHKEMLYQVLSFFEINPDVDLGGMKNNQTLFDVTTNVLCGLEGVIDDYNPDYLVVQGDTTSAFAGALAGFYKKVKVIHLEAGLRSGDLYSPWPEEGNRQLISKLAALHFTPTYKATAALKAEGVETGIYQVGNTVIDALLLADEKIRKDNQFAAQFPSIDFSKRVILITGHRRESFGEPFRQMCEAIKTLASNYPDCYFLYPVHLNPNVQKQVYETLTGVPNVFLVPPVDYPTMVWLLRNSFLVLTDSGGIQEEAPTFGKPVLVMRDVTERTEGIEAGTAKLVGTGRDNIIKAVSLLLDDANAYAKMAKAVNPYGDGTTCEQIVKILGNQQI
jgi:UDP-N-acetylglucosamine 2-epimerase (non-hydrolysing)